MRNLHKCCFLIPFKVISVLSFTREEKMLIYIMTHSCGYRVAFEIRYSTDSQDLDLRRKRKVAMVDKFLCGQGVNG